MKRIVLSLIILPFFTANPCLATAPRYGRDTVISDVNVAISFNAGGSERVLVPFRLGDINGDGYDDFCFIGGGGREQLPYTMRIFFGKPHWSFSDGASQPDVTLETGENTWLTMSSVYPGDFDNDGLDDLVFWQGSQFDGGHTGILFGRRNGWPASGQLFGAADITLPVILAGMQAQFLGDFDGDGLEDLALGTRPDNTGVTALILLGKPARPHTSSELLADARTFHSSSNTFPYFQGDFDGDGRDDLGAGDAGGTRCLFYGTGAPLPPNYSNLWNLGRDEVCNCFVGSSRAGMADQGTSGFFSDRFFPDIVVGDRLTKDFQGRVTFIPGNPYLGEAVLDLDHLPYFRGVGVEFLGTGVLNGGDVNSDGYDDLVFSAEGWNGDSRVFCALGGPGKWTVEDMPETLAEMSFRSNRGGRLGYWMANVGDVNGDAIDDWCFAAYGETFLVFPALNTRPSPIQKIEVFTDANATVPLARPFQVWERAVIAVTATDRDPAERNVCEVILRSGGYTAPRGLLVRCKETGPNTGRFLGDVMLSDTGANRFFRRMRVLRNDTVTVTSKEDTNVTATFTVRDVTATPTPTVTPTPTPTRGPHIQMAGYWDTRLEAGRPGVVACVALVTGLELDYLTPYSVYLLYQGDFTTHEMKDYFPPFPNLDNLWGNQYHLGAPSGPQRILLEFALTKSPSDPIEDSWPYLKVNP